MSFKSGFVALVGRPNVGKSTLLNGLFAEKIAIVSDKAQTTRNAIRGIKTTDEYQLVFIDTPGIHEPKDELGRQLNRESFSQLEGVDIVYFLVDGSSHFGKQDQKILDRVIDSGAKIFLVVNKIDKLNKTALLLKLQELASLHNFDEIIPISAKATDNIDRLLTITQDYLEEGPAYFSTEQRVQVDYEKQFLLAELIREKILHYTKDEIPHDVAVVIENLEEDESSMLVEALVVVSRDSQKPILLGKQGSMIKKIREGARRQMRQKYNKSVELELYVRVEKDWRTKQTKLKDLGYSDE